MPYALSTDGLCVVEKDTGKQLKCYDTHADALAYLGSLESNVQEKGVIPQGNDEVDILAAPFNGQANGKDAHGQYFSAQTKFHEDLIPLPPVTYYHNYNSDGSPQGNPEAIGRTTKRWQDEQGVWYRAKLDLRKDGAQKVMQSAQTNRARASSGVVKAFHRVDSKGHIKDWLIGEVSAFDVNPELKQVPANTFAVVLPVMKAMYAELEIPYPQKLGNSPMPTSVKELIHFLMSMMLTGDSAEPDVAEEVKTEDTNKPRMPHSKPEEERLNQQEEKSLRDQIVLLEQQNATMKMAGNSQEAESFVKAQIASFKLLPSEKDMHVEMYLQAKQDDELHADTTMKFASGNANRLAQFKAMVEMRESHTLTVETMKSVQLLGNDSPPKEVINEARLASMRNAQKSALGITRKGVN